MIGVLVSSVGDPCADTNVVNKLVVPKTYSDRRLSNNRIRVYLITYQ